MTDKKDNHPTEEEFAAEMRDLLGDDADAELEYPAEIVMPPEPKEGDKEVEQQLEPEVVKTKTKATVYKPPVNTDAFPLRTPNSRVSKDDVARIKADILKVTSEMGDQNKAAELRNTVNGLLDSAQDILFPNGERNTFFDNPNLTQVVKTSKGKSLRNGSLRFALSENLEELEGNQAVRYITSVTGVGSPSRGLLWSSGITLSLDSVSDDDIVTLHAQMERDNIYLGQNSNGRSYSGDDYYNIATLAKFVLNSLSSSNLKGAKYETLLDLIRVTDIDSMLTLGLATMYPSGYPLTHYCTNTAKCSYVLTPEHVDPEDPLSGFKPDSMLNFNQLPWIDHAKLTPGHVEHMSKIDNEVTIQDVKNYQSTLPSLAISEEGVLISSTDRVSVYVSFKVPTLREYFKAAGAWAGMVMNNVNKVLIDEAEPDEEAVYNRRMQLLMEYTNATEIAKHLHWISHIRFVESDGTVRFVRDETTIRQTLGRICRMKGFMVNFDKELLAYKDSVTISGCAMDAFECPSCGHHQGNQNPNYPELIPVNMPNYFFLITELRNLLHWQTRLQE